MVCLFRKDVDTCWWLDVKRFFSTVTVKGSILKASEQFQDFLTVIMEAGGATEPAENDMGPDAFYVEEVQATLAHIQELGLSIVAERVLLSNGGFQIATPLPPPNKKKNDFIGQFAAI